jgi:hypothetical protein
MADQQAVCKLMTTINTVLGFVSIAGALLVGVAVLAFVVALWINQPQINKQQLAGSAYEQKLESLSYPLSNVQAGSNPCSHGVDMKKKAHTGSGESLPY